MYLHSLHFTVCLSHHSYIPTFIAFLCVCSIPCMGDLFALRLLSLPLCTYIHYIGFNFLHGSPVLQCTYIHCISLCEFEFNSLCASPPGPCTYIHFIHCICSIPCVGNLFALSPPPCTYIYCVHCIYCMGSIHCMGPHQQHVPTFTSFTVWVQFTASVTILH